MKRGRFRGDGRVRVPTSGFGATQGDAPDASGIGLDPEI